MKTLKQVRQEKGIPQGDISKLLGINQATVSQIESGAMTPSVEDMTIMENYFSQPINWGDSIAENQKWSCLHSIMVLAEAFPLSSVLHFAQRCIKIDQKFGQPDRTLKHFAQLSQSFRGDSLPQDKE